MYPQCAKIASWIPYLSVKKYKSKDAGIFVKKLIKKSPFIWSTSVDTSGIEAWVTENNPKYANRIIKQLKAFKKSHNLDDSYDPYKAAYGSMPTHAASNQAIQQMYINGHFCYAYKFGIVRDITFYNKEFLKAHPDIVVEKKSDSPDEDKSLADSKALLPVLVDFFQKHPLIAPKTFLGDAAFDTIEKISFR